MMRFRSFRCRRFALSGIHPCYTWSVFAKTFGDQENFGRILFEEKVYPQIIKDGDFAKPVIQKRFLGSWSCNTPLAKDKTIFIHNGESLKLVNEQSLAQVVKFKPETEYIMVFWVKLDDKSYFYSNMLLQIFRHP